MIKRQVRGNALTAVMAVVALLAGCTPTASRGTFAVPPAACTDAALLFARGSSMPVGSGQYTELQGWLRSAMSAMSRTPTYSTLELGDLDNDKRIDEGGYPAVAGADYLGLDANAEPGRDLAIIGGYNESTRIGADELVSVISTLHTRCPDQVFVVVGVSQGADAVMKGLSRMPSELLPMVAAVHVFGDPGFVLGPWVMAPGTVIPSGHGILGPRVPYVPSDLASRTRSWCAMFDGVCTGQFWLSLLDTIDECPDHRDLPVCAARHIDYSVWAYEPAMKQAAASVSAFTA